MDRNFGLYRTGGKSLEKPCVQPGLDLRWPSRFETQTGIFHEFREGNGAGNLGKDAIFAAVPVLAHGMHFLINRLSKPIHYRNFSENEAVR